MPALCERERSECFRQNKRRLLQLRDLQGDEFLFPCGNEIRENSRSETFRLNEDVHAISIGYVKRPCGGGGGDDIRQGERKAESERSIEFHRGFLCSLGRGLVGFGSYVSASVHPKKVTFFPKSVHFRALGDKGKILLELQNHDLFSAVG